MVLVVCDGDSVTAGVGGVPSYVAAIAADCNTYAAITPTVTNKAVIGQNSYQMLWGAAGSASAPGADGLAQEILSLHPDVVVWCTGLNDVLWQAAGHSDAELVAVYRAYIDAVLATPAPNGSPTPIVCLSDNFSGQNLGGGSPRPAAAQDHVHTLWRQTLQEYAGNAYVCIVDVYPSFRRYGTDTAALYGALQADTVHPTAAGYHAFEYSQMYLLANLVYAANAGAYSATVPNPAPLRPASITLPLAALRLAEGEYVMDNGQKVTVSVPAAF